MYMCTSGRKKSVFVLFCDVKYRMVAVVATATSTNETMRTKRERERKKNEH